MWNSKRGPLTWFRGQSAAVGRSPPRPADKRGPGVPLASKRRARAAKTFILKGFGVSLVQLRRATLYPAELRVRGVHLAD
jgi:hypothetical protein